ncbi:BamA/TamA family outer membrane protein [Mariniflexile ostreae]|uniref:BamA/TamA family outer membrane protein n=1 Tax=Mariniflexile ostreae TaxID=1520892 RepID=A0ABV5FA50_9FLAO
MKTQLSKISIFLVCLGLFSCDAVKRVPDNDHLLIKNTVNINDKKNKTETLSNLLFQKPNRSLLGIPLRLHVYNLARPNIDSIVDADINKNPKKKQRLEKLLSKKQLNKYIESRKGFNNWLKKTGEPPITIDSVKTVKSLKNLKDYHVNNGWFDVDVSYHIDHTEEKRAAISYEVQTGKAYIIDSIFKQIKSPVIDSLYLKKIKANSLIKKGEQYRTASFEVERNRISEILRNSGVYHFNQDYITVEMDTIGTNKKVNVTVQIQDRAIRGIDSIIREPFKVYKVKDVNIYPNTNFSNLDETVTDSVYYKGYNIYSIGKMRFNPESLTDAVFISPKRIFKDIDRIRTYRYISELRTFKYPDIKYIENPDATLTANVYLTPLKKFNLGLNTDVSTSDIQSIGFSLNPSLLIRNIFKGAETLEISAIGAIGASEDRNRKDSPFFDINEIGLNLKLTIPRIFSPFNTDQIVPNYMSPSTRISLASTSQTNIGLDKQTFIGAFNYNWLPSKQVSNKLDLFNVQYIRNLNAGNYFRVYGNSFNSLNAISKSLNYNNGVDLLYPVQTDAFIKEVLNGNTALTPNSADFKTVSSINERKERLTENNLIFSSSFNFIKNTQRNLFDENFSIFRYKIELAGNLLANTSTLLGLKKDASDRYTIFDVAFSQYAKTEIDYIKRWDLGNKNVFAIRSFLGIAIPYGNSNNIPFAKSFFAGGANDNRAWSAYSLGPGSSVTTDEFNEANLKIALSAEQRFNLFGNLNGAVFIDAGNIWNVFDNTETGPATFDNFKSLKDIAVGSGFGLRYDFSFFVFRFDIGFKTYDPSYQDENRWFNDYNFTNAVYNIGINYPF